MYKQITGDQIRAARALLNWSQKRLGDEASMTQTPIASMEKDIESCRESTVRLVVMTLENNGIEFFREEDGTIGVKLRPQKAGLNIFGY